MATGELDFTISYVDTPGYRSTGELIGPTYYAIEDVTGFAHPFSAYPRPFYKGVTVRVATGFGAGTSLTTRVVVSIRTATGSGTGTQSATAIEILPRSATGSGQGTTSGGATGLLTAKRTATGNGTSSSEVVQFWGKVRLATSSGTGTSVVVYRREIFRTASGSGTGTDSASGRKMYRATATGSGTGTQSLASFYKVLFFRPPTDDLVRWAEFNGTGLGNRLFRFVVPGPRGRNVYKLTDSTFTEADQHDLSVVSRVYYGGHDNPITQAEKTDLISAGYGDYVT